MFTGPASCPPELRSGRSAIRAINLYRPEINLPSSEAILLFEVDGNPSSVEWEGRQISEILGKRAFSLEWATIQTGWQTYGGGAASLP